MQLQESLSHIDYLQVTDSDSCETFCGSDQEWFPTEQQRLTGCGPSAVRCSYCISQSGSWCRRSPGKLALGNDYLDIPHKGWAGSTGIYL